MRGAISIPSDSGRFPGQSPENHNLMDARFVRFRGAPRFSGVGEAQEAEF